MRVKVKLIYLLFVQDDSTAWFARRWEDFPSEGSLWEFRSISQG